MAAVRTGAEARRFGPLALPAWVPHGGQLPLAMWEARHRGILVLLWAHVAFIPAFALTNGYHLGHSAGETAAVALPTLVASWSRLRPRSRTFAASFGLLTASAVLVHLSSGVIEMHFHFFVMVAVVALYQDWVPFLAAIAYVLVHHGIVGTLDPETVYNHPAAIASPWRWAGIHALFILGTSVACIVTWRLNERALEKERRAEHRLREQTAVVEALHAVGRTLAEQLDPQAVVQAVTDAATRLSEAAFGAFFHNVIDEAGESYTLYTLSGAPREAFERFPLPRNTAIFEPTFVGAGVVRIDDVLADPRYGHNAPYHGMPKGHLAVRSYLAVPVRSRQGDVIGGLFFGHPEPGRFTDVHERIVTGISAQASVALDNARLYESERSSRLASEAARARLTLLAEVSSALASSLETAEILSRVAALVAPAIGDVCTIDLRREDGTITRAAVAGGQHLTIEDRATLDESPQPQDEAHPTVRAILAARRAVADGDEVVPLELDPERDGAAGIALPLRAHDRVLGCMSVTVPPGSERSIGTGDDRRLLLEIASRVAVAVENARLFAHQRTVAETLQHSLLPERLPEIPGMEMAARYVSGGPEIDVGGDWYDVIPLSGGAVAFAMGDVVGRGERAASLMGQIRNALRAYALAGLGPAEIVQQLNRVVLALGPESMATLVYGVIDPDTGTMRFVNAGHPPPLVVNGSGGASFLTGEGGVPLGAIGRARYVETVTSLQPGATLLFYTDGLIEDRRETLDEGFEKLTEVALSGPADLEAFCDHLLLRSLRDRDTEDDVAVIAVRLVPMDEHLLLRLPRDPSLLAPLRATLRRWLTAGGATEEETFEILVAAGEACSNAVQHAHGPAASGFEIEGTLDGELCLTIRDGGRWREPQQQRGGGRGIGIMRAFMDRVEIDSGADGTSVTMHRRLRTHVLNGAGR